MKRFFTFVLVAVLASTSGSGQSPAPAKRQRPLPDFDARELATPEMASLRAGSMGVVQRRTAVLGAFMKTPEESRLGTRIVSNQYGLPKLYLRDGHSLSAASPLPSADIAKSFLRAHSAAFAMSDPEVEGLRLLADDVTDSARFVAFNQTVGGIDVFNAQIKFTLNKNGEVVQVAAGDVVPGLNI